MMGSSSSVRASDEGEGDGEMGNVRLQRPVVMIGAAAYAGSRRDARGRAGCGSWANDRWLVIVNGWSSTNGDGCCRRWKPWTDHGGQLLQAWMLWK
ncbi:hypothetical protein ACLOJK_027389 [Asimina triloba]